MRGLILTTLAVLSNRSMKMARRIRNAAFRTEREMVGFSLTLAFSGRGKKSFHIGSARGEKGVVRKCPRQTTMRKPFRHNEL